MPYLRCSTGSRCQAPSNADHSKAWERRTDRAVVRFEARAAIAIDGDGVLIVVRLTRDCFECRVVPARDVPGLGSARRLSYRSVQPPGRCPWRAPRPPRPERERNQTERYFTHSLLLCDWAAECSPMRQGSGGPVNFGCSSGGPHGRASRKTRPRPHVEPLRSPASYELTPARARALPTRCEVCNRRFRARRSAERRSHRSHGQPELPLYTQMLDRSAPTRRPNAPRAPER